MIDKSTLFILGAGASFPYGYPTGQGLREYIFTKFPDDYSGLLRVYYSSDNSYSRAMREVTEFSKAFANSPRVFIDEFLSINQQYQDIGKAAIATAILTYERKSKFNEKVRNHQSHK